MVLLDLNLTDSASETIEYIFEFSDFAAVIVLTGNDDDNVSARCFEHGAGAPRPWGV